MATNVIMHIFYKEVEIAVAALKKGKSGIVDNIPVELMDENLQLFLSNS